LAHHEKLEEEFGRYAVALGPRQEATLELSVDEVIFFGLGPGSLNGD
jgi:hypothetical protein